GGHDDGFGAGFDVWPPGIDVDLGFGVGGLAGAQMAVERTAATGCRWRNELDAEPRQHLRRRRVRRRCRAWLHAAAEYEHAARGFAVVELRDVALARRNLRRQRLQRPAHEWPEQAP